MGSATAPGAVFRALAKNNSTHGLNRRLRLHPYEQIAGGEAPPVTPGAVMLPN